MKPNSTAGTGASDAKPSSAAISCNNSDLPMSENSGGGAGVDDGGGGAGRESITSFTDHGQVDAELALARTLQDQETTYIMQQMTGDGSDYASQEGGSDYHDDEYDDGDLDDDHYDEFEEDDEDEKEEEEEEDELLNDDGTHDEEEEDAFDVNAHADSGDSDVEPAEFDPTPFPDDHEIARFFETHEMEDRLWDMTGIADGEDLNMEGGDNISQVHEDTWEELDSGELWYESLIAQSEVAGTETRGLLPATIASLPTVSYRSDKIIDGDADSCVICLLDYEDGDSLIMLSCKHSYHSECISNWLKINKVCPLCGVEVSSSAMGSS